MQPSRVSKLVSFPILGLVMLLGVGCQPKSAPAPDRPAKQSAEDNRSIYRQAIDEAKSLEKRINDRAIDPEEKGRFGGEQSPGQDQ